MITPRLYRKLLSFVTARLDGNGVFTGPGAKELRAIPGISWLNFGMNIQVAVLCDAATDDNGKMNLLGAFDTIYTQKLPAIHPQCSIALRVTFSSDDEGKHALQVNFVD